MGKELKVLMMGGQRVGKSSALAAIMDSFINGPVSSLLIAEDITEFETTDGVQQISIKKRLKDLKTKLSKSVGKTILMDSGKTFNKWDYTLQLSVPRTSKRMKITFTDINGEFFEGGNIHQEQTLELIKSYDVFIIAIDTTYMMEARKKQLVNDVINSKFNCIDSIHTFLTEIDDKDGLDAKLVIFTPIKCERWAKTNQLELVSDYAQEDYRTAITGLKHYKNVQIEVLPVQTIGSVVFREHKEAFLCKWTKRILLFFEKEYISKCSKLNDKKVRLSDGMEISASSDMLLEDVTAVLIPNTMIVRPNAWFDVVSEQYAPHNCEQLAFHILEFMLAKVIDAKIRKDENTNGIIKILSQVGNGLLNIATLGLWDDLKDIFGGISIDNMDDIINQMYQNRLIQTHGEGIQIIKKCNFKQLKK